MPSRSSRSPSETGEERRDGRHPGSTRRLAHNQREQRRARRINDKIMEMKTMMEVSPCSPAYKVSVDPSSYASSLQSHGRNVKKDKYSILMSAVAHMEVLFELLCEEAKKNGSEAKGKRRLRLCAQRRLHASRCSRACRFNRKAHFH